MRQKRPSKNAVYFWTGPKVQKQQRQFYLIMAAGGIVMAILHTIRQRPEMARYMVVATAVFLVIEFIFPTVGKRVFGLWMKFAHILGTVNTFILITVVFFAVITPVGLIRRLLAKQSPHSAASCRTRKSSWFKLSDEHRYADQF